MDDHKWYVPNIPIEDLFVIQEYPDLAKEIPLRWWTMKTVAEVLDVSERTVRNYKASGKLEYKYRMINGHRKIYFTNRSVIRVKRDKEWRKEPKEIDTDDVDIECDTDNLTNEEILKLNAVSCILSELIK